VLDRQATPPICVGFVQLFFSVVGVVLRLVTEFRCADSAV
jgi:hypothetical protein